MAINPFTIAGVVLAVAALAAAILVLLRAQRAGADIARQFADLRSQLAAEQDAAARIDSHLRQLREAVELRLAETSLDLRNQAVEFREMIRAQAETARANTGQQFDALRAALATLSTSASFQEAVDGLSRQITDSLERSDRLSESIAGLPGQVSSLVEPVSRQVERLSQRTGSIEAQAAELSLKAKSLGSRAESAAATLARLEDLIENLLRQPAQDEPLDGSLFDKKSQAEMVALAESLADAPRSLVPYPRWHWDADWSNTDFAFVLRQRLWRWFHDHRWEAPVTVPWHYGTHLALYLGNDLSRQIYVGNCIDPNEFAFLDRFLQPGMTFLDAGANEGVYSVFAASRVGARGMVWAFEPSGRELVRLRHNLQMNGLNVCVSEIALADFSGPATLRVAGYEHEGQNTLGDFAYAWQTERTETVNAARLDDLVAGNPPQRIDVIKADVEGAELRLFQGAAGTLRRYRPVLLFEAADASLRHQGSSREELTRFLQTQGYTLYVFDRQTGLPAPAHAGAFSDNMLGVPNGAALPDAVFAPWPASTAPA